MSNNDAATRTGPDPASVEWAYGTHLDQPLTPADGELASEQGVPALEGEDNRAGSGDGPGHDEDRREPSSGGAAARGPERTPSQRTPDQRKPDQERPGKPGGEPDDRNKGGERKDAEPPPPPPSKWVFIGAGLVLVALLAWGGYTHWRRHSASSEAQQNTVNRVTPVRTVEAKRNDAPVDLALPGQTEALLTANLYARATGYVTERHADIGTHVKKGDLLLHIAAPDLDQQLAQAEAQVGQVKASEAQAQAQVTQADANVNLAKVTLARTAALTDRGFETLQNRDNQTATLLSQQANLETAKAGVKVAEANTKAQLATVDRLKALASFEDVIAPFDGTVTVRNVDVGDLVSADSATAMPLFTVQKDDIIRATVQVPQNAAPGVRNGLPAKVEVPQLPGQVFTGTVTRSSGALLSSARTLDTEVDIPNLDHRLRAGLFAYITISIPRAHPTVTVPAEAMIFNQHGLQVATVENNKIKLHNVRVDRDHGTTVDLAEGLNGGEQVVLSPPAILPDGAPVKATEAEDKRPEGGDQPDKSKKNDQPGDSHPASSQSGEGASSSSKDGGSGGQGSDTGASKTDGKNQNSSKSQGDSKSQGAEGDDQNKTSQAPSSDGTAQ